MGNFTQEEISQRLMYEFDYPEKGAGLIAEQIVNFQPEVRAAFNRWWQTGQLTSFAIEGYTIERLQTEHSMNPIAAFLTLDWLLTEPEAAHASLQRGHDKIT
ncbi:MAG: hypothetical protein KDJ52_09880 [Anaerolineae bacterium]|nr:hypothetical protein [Anaerolineae bacterium]